MIDGAATKEVKDETRRRSYNIFPDLLTLTTFPDFDLSVAPTRLWMLGS
jgi:hypothetical protein